ncbi:hypothetical protein AQUCO_00200002v1 [Aquilegia coerulea]|uniref:Uncharacterized protein n=1 Tax=Aquilegia coerulea TaxID=218851 RepID=A0A2G5F153_AQUCA|nr:hypothetical protein AQUCO_00200002v1 [Aquilegia coerulea]
MKALLNDTICLVGVFGMPGIGKTKLMEALSKRVKEEKLFDEVVMVTISEKPDVKAIQNNVAKELGMRLDDSESISCRARRLHDRLNQTEDKRILIVLDDLWNELNLEVVGIPKKSRRKSYKIVITTRIQQVCARMGTDLEWAVPILSNQDSWTLFRKNVGDVVDSRQLERIAREVVDECAGYNIEYIKMHDVVRDVAKMIAFKDEELKQRVEAGMDLMKWPEQLESCKRLSLMRSKIVCDLPRQVEAPQLLTLILNGCNRFSELPCDFFEKMKKLKNLDLSYTDIASLPSSVSCLVELRTLRLVWCYDLKNISPVEKLEKLEILDLYESGVETLPEEMGMLTKLKSLNMSICISQKVISSMYQLEELRVW